MTDAPMSIDEAVAALSGPEDTTLEAPEVAAEEKQESEADQTADDEAEPEEDTGDEEGDDSEPQEAIAPPPFWNADAKERWTKLDPDTQAYVLEREQQRDAATQRTLQEAANARKASEAEAQRVSAFVAHLNELSQRVDQVFATEWASVNWSELSQTDPAEYVRLQEVYRQDQADKLALQQSKLQAEQLARQSMLMEEARRLQQINPELASNPQAVGEVGVWLRDQGFPSETLNDISAVELSIAHKAMMYDRLKAQDFKPTPAAQQPAKSSGKALKPSAVGTREAPQTQRKQALMSKRSLTIDEAVALL